MNPYTKQWRACQRMYFLAERLLDYYDVFVLHSADTMNYKVYKKNNFVSIPIFINRKKSIKHLKFIKKVFRYFIYNMKLLYDIIIYNEINRGDSLLVNEFIKKAKNVIVKLVREKKIELVVISAPPFSIFNVIKFIKKRFPEVRIIVDYRDPWNLDGCTCF